MIVGAWGCGAFAPQDDSETYIKKMANEFLIAVKKNSRYFDEVVFAIPNKTGRNYRIFERVFKDAGFFV